MNQSFVTRTTPRVANAKCLCEKTLYNEEKIPYQATIMKWKGVGLHYCYNAKLLSNILALIEPPFVDVTYYSCIFVLLDLMGIVYALGHCVFCIGCLV
jgi:hypothetical protein